MSKKINEMKDCELDALKNLLESIDSDGVSVLYKELYNEINMREEAKKKAEEEAKRKEEEKARARKIAEKLKQEALVEKQKSILGKFFKKENKKTGTTYYKVTGVDGDKAILQTIWRNSEECLLQYNYNLSIDDLKNFAEISSDEFYSAKRDYEKAANSTKYTDDLFNDMKSWFHHVWF